MKDDNPDYWFRPIDTINDFLTTNPKAIEYLKADTGECFIHLYGSAFFDDFTKSFRVDMLRGANITHWRIRKLKTYVE